MFYLICAILIAGGIALALYGLKQYGLSLAIAVVLPSLAFLSILDYISTTSIIVVLVVGLLVFFLSKPFTYLYGWFVGAYLILLPFFIIYKTMGLEMSHSAYSYTALLSIIASLVAIIIYRKHLKAWVIGISSGLIAGIGLVGMISIEIFKTGITEQDLYLLSILTLLGIAGGILFQYLYVIKNNPELVSFKKGD